MIRIGALEIPDRAGHGIRQTYRKLGGRQILRSKNGSGILASRWRKLGVSVSGTGWLPDGLDGLDEDAAADIHCIAWLGVSSVSNVIAIPRAFRSDEFAPQGLAVVGGDSVETSIALAGSVATLGAVAGASLYQVSYCPVVTALINSITRDYDQQAHRWSWAIEAEEQ